MNTKKILSIISLAGVMAMNVQPIASSMSNNKVLLASTTKIEKSNETNKTIIKNNSLDNQKIQLFCDYYGPYISGAIKFNTINNKIEISPINNRKFSNTRTNKAFSITLYSKDGTIIKSKSYSDSENINDIAKDFNGLTFNYGDRISIQSTGLYVWTSGIDSRSNYPEDLGTNAKPNENINYEITQDGLKKIEDNLIVNPIYFTLNSNKINVSGKAKPNMIVNIWVDNKDYKTTSDSKGIYNLDITADKNITVSTKIKVLAEGEKEKIVNPILNPNIYKISENNISIDNIWNQHIGTLKFNPLTSKIEFIKDWAQINPYVSKDDEVFSISMYKSNGKLVKTVKVKGTEHPQTELSNTFNNLNFSYGDIIKIDYKKSSKLKISNFNNEKQYLINKPIEMKITQDGLKLCDMTEIKVNPFGVLGNGKITTGIISGNINKANQVVNVIVEGKEFTTKSNSEGKFEVNISDVNGFTNETNILVETDGQLTTTINPSVNKNLGILKSKIYISDKNKDATYGQTISFNPATMTVNNERGKAFAAQLIDGKSGKLIASCATSNFNVFDSKEDLNGAHFKYGDIIAVYESKETQLSCGNLLLDDGKTKIDAVDKFKCFKITPSGLVPLENKDLITSQALYKGNQNIVLTGKTLPNADVNAYFNNGSKIVKADNNGNFSIEIPINDAPIDSEIRVFVNNDNNKILTVKYDSNLININTNRIEVLNNTNVPIFNVSFNPVNNTLQAAANPLSKTYTGAFYGDSLNIKLIDSKTGKYIYSFKGNKLDDINGFISEVNNKNYKLGDIIEVSYNPQFVKANVYDGKNSIGNTTGAKEYFEITNKGLVNLNNKFINVKPLDILSNEKVISANIEGTAKPNTFVDVSVDGNIFKGMTNGNGNFNIAINDKDGFTNNTNIIVSSEGYIPTQITPSIKSNIQLMNSYINFYDNQGWQGKLSSSITFNPQTMKFIVNNYADSFGDGKSHYFNFNLYNTNGDKILSSSVNNGATSQLTNLLNEKSFNYGDIIGLSYNKDISRPVVLNGNKILSNISGDEEYFKITKEGLVKVNFGQNAYTSNVSWDNNNLVVDSNIANGQSENILKANKKLVILDSNNKIVDSVNTSILNNNELSVQAIIPESILNKLVVGQHYTFALEVNNKLFPIKVSSNTPSNSKYILEGNSDNLLLIAVTEKSVINIDKSSDISSYAKEFEININSMMNTNNNADILGSDKLNYDITTREFITRVGETNLENFFNKSEANKEFINWVLNNKIAMQEYLQATNPKEMNINGLQIWSDIWNKYTNSRTGFNLKLAIAVAVSNATPIKAWPGKGTVGDPVERYNIFETLNEEGEMLPIFKTLDIRHIMYVVNTHIPNSQILGMRAVIMQNHNAFINANGHSGLNNIAYTINYNEINPHTGVSVFGPDFYGANPSPLDVWYDGGVCGSTSYIGASACQIFGMPAQPVGQPGHCAFIFYNNQKEWVLGNNISGWSGSSGADISGWSKGIATNGNVTNYNLLYENIDKQKLSNSNEYLWLASSRTSYKDKMNAIDKAISIEPLNLEAWLDKINLMKTNNNLTVKDYMNLSEEIIKALKDYPMPMFDILLQIKNQILNNGTTLDYNYYVDSIQKALNLVENPNQKPIAKDMLNLMPKEGLEKGVTPLTNSSITINNIWNQSLAKLGFNTLSMKMNVNKGWSVINPYLKERAFTIGLYNKNNELIKSVTLKGGDYPEDPLYNAFNNLDFKYGDKIFIDYNRSSKISISHLYKDNILNNSYDVNKSSVFEITKNGLVYIGDSIN
ncbi:hypothetical protein [Clostridium mediterraneense]|uniref:hypothetical protein n=1 Tax=Clostridium mediterraneense TaxID=1805472 RepID=UPI00082A3EE6|nr:hypothetical protein [Clostridium mediterraneense]